MWDMVIFATESSPPTMIQNSEDADIGKTLLQVTDILQFRQRLPSIEHLVAA